MAMIAQYFPNITETQRRQFAQLEKLYPEWNEKINVISRADIDQLSIRHILHSLAIAKFNLLQGSSNILDVGTGGGFPGIPLAIMYPDKNFTLIDSIGKKIAVVNDIIAQIGLRNAEGIQIKSNMLKRRFDTITSRAVTAFPNFVKQTINNLEKQKTSRIVYLKGGDFMEEIAPYSGKTRIYNIPDVFGDEFFETKKVIEFFPWGISQ
ncbi:MAG: 16S rRNA (guanine(527)-N(7))-methyltransferase RsmG [Bacteroidales bacterium]|nr:16S rRNA (guanine(527)-N(7))-methyltransferase RsmG [Bacteroidales bacterium]